MMVAPILPLRAYVFAFASAGAIAALLSGCAGQQPNVSAPATRHSHHRYVPDHLARLATEVAGEERISPTTALALVQVESGFNPQARSSAGAIGLTQIKCPTARAEGYVGPCSGLYDPRTNLTFGLRYLRGNLDQESGQECRALGLYNSGRWGAPNWRYCHAVQSAKMLFAEE